MHWNELMIKGFFTKRKLEVGKIIKSLQHQNESLKKFSLEIKYFIANYQVGKCLLIARYKNIRVGCEMSETVAQGCSVKKVFLEISQIHRKTPVPETLF